MRRLRHLCIACVAVAATREAFAQAGITEVEGRWVYRQTKRQEVIEHVLEDPWQVGDGEREKWLTRARRQKDIEKLAARRTHFGLLDDEIDWDGVNQFRRRLRLAADEYALMISINFNDVVCNDRASHWNGGKKACACGAEVETQHHRMWECPRQDSVRYRGLGPQLMYGRLREIPQVTKTLGLPTILPNILSWRSTWGCIEGSVGAAQVYYLDGSAVHPRDSHLRRVAWAAAWETEHGWEETGGTVPGKQTVGRAELYALICVA